MNADIVVREITAEETHHLRRAILRDGDVEAALEWPGDTDDGSAHIGAIVDGRVAAISTWLVARDPLEPDRNAVQLRGMATDPAAAGRGLGRAILAAGTRRATDRGHNRVWANARVTALGFYESAGWTVTGPVFETAVTGLPHRHVHIDLV